MSSPPFGSDAAGVNPYATPRKTDPAPRSSRLDGSLLPPRTAVVGFLQATIVVSVLSILADANIMFVLRDGAPSMPVAERADMFVAVVGGLTLLVTLGTAITWCMWVVQAAKNARALDPDGYFEYTPASQAWWYFVPFANLVKPLHATREIWNHSLPVDEDSSLLTRWWGAWIMSNIAAHIAFRITPTDGSGARYIDRLIIASGVSIVATLVSVVAAVLAIRVVRTLNQAQGGAR